MNIFRLDHVPFKYIVLQKEMEFLLLKNAFLMYDSVKVIAGGKYNLNGRLQ